MLGIIKKEGIGKRGQITIFIILGIVILLLIAFIIILQRQGIIFRPEEVYPPEVMPLKNFVEACAKSVAEEAVMLLGANGGYLEFPEEIENDPSSAISSGAYFPDVKTVLWRYNGQDRTPTEPMMEYQLENYIKENLNDCILGLEPFKNQLEIREIRQMKPIVTLADESVNVKLDYPIELIIKTKNQTIIIPEFTASVPVRLKTVFALAEKIMQSENNQLFIEDRTIDLISLDPDIPYTDFEFSCKPKTWFVSDINAKLKQLLAINLPLIRVDKTAYEPVPPGRPYEELHYLWKITDLKYPSTRVSFSYDEKWPFYLYIRPNQGPILKSGTQKGHELFSMICMQFWHFTYDVKYPVRVTIVDEAAGKHERYVFNFGFTSIIKSNLPQKESLTASPYEFKQTPESEEFCAERPTVKMTVHTWENVSSGEQEIYDELSDVNISYTCLKYTCNLGVSKKLYRGAITALIADFPLCPDGVLRGKKDGYLAAETFVQANKEKSVNLYLRPVKQINYTVVKHYRYRPAEEKPLEADEGAIITVKGNSLESTGFNVDTTDTIIEGETQSLTLLANWDYTYDLTIYLTDDTGITGGYKTDWTVEWQDIKDASLIRFHVIEWPYTADEEEKFSQLSGLSAESSTIPKPEVI